MDFTTEVTLNTRPGSVFVHVETSSLDLALDMEDHAFWTIVTANTPPAEDSSSAAPSPVLGPDRCPTWAKTKVKGVDSLGSDTNEIEEFDMDAEVLVGPRMIIA